MIATSGGLKYPSHRTQHPGGARVDWLFMAENGLFVVTGMSRGCNLNNFATYQCVHWKLLFSVNVLFKLRTDALKLN